MRTSPGTPPLDLSRLPKLTDVLHRPHTGAGEGSARADSPPASPDTLAIDIPLPLDGRAAPPGTAPASPTVWTPEEVPGVVPFEAPFEALVAVAHVRGDAQPLDFTATQVLQSVQRHADRMLEYRLRDMLDPLLEQLSAKLVHDVREHLAPTLQDIIARAVSQELAQQRREPTRRTPKGAD